MWRKLSKLYQTNHTIFVGLVLVISILLAWQDRFILDDAFISLRYADNLVRGQGLVWNPGERVEGYTNFLWTLIMVLPLVLGIEPITFLYVLGVGIFAICLLYTYKLAKLVTDNVNWAILVVITLGINPAFHAFATGGLETMLQATLFVLAAYQTLHCIHRDKWSVKRLLILGFTFAVMLLTRLDSAIFVVVFFPVVLWRLWWGKKKISDRFLKSIALTLPPLIIVGVWLIWKVSYYGQILPNTFYARPVGNAWLRGLYYVGTFIWTYGLVFTLPAVIMAIIVWWRRENRMINMMVAPLVIFLLLWWAFLVSVGGDWMSFRLMVPVMPFVYILAIWIIWRQLDRIRLQVLLTVILIMAALSPLPFKVAADVYKTPSDLTDHFENLRLPEIGLRLGEMLGSDGDVKIAITDAGTIPYYSRLRTVDMLGLNDPWVLGNGILLVPSETFGSLPGHMRIAPVEYLREKNVNLIINHPWWTNEPDGGYRRYSWHEFAYLWPGFPLMFADEPEKQPADALVVIPIADDLHLRAIYLTPHPVVDAAIEEYEWQVIPILR